MKPKAGDVFSRWTVVEELKPTESYVYHFKCACSCGTVRLVHGSNLIKGASKSCGCLRLELQSTRGPRTPEYGIWAAMLQRCFNPKSTGYQRYGGRGITVCSSWRRFENFIRDMGRRPSENHSLDRYPDNNGNYEPGNVRWTTRDKQSRNTRRNCFILVNGKSMVLCDAAIMFGIKVPTLVARMRLGWGIGFALSGPTTRNSKYEREEKRTHVCNTSTHVTI